MRTKNRITLPRLLSLILALLLFVTVIAACDAGEGSAGALEGTSEGISESNSESAAADGSPDTPAREESTTEDPTESTAPEETLPDWAVDCGDENTPTDQFPDKNYGNEITVLHWSDVEMPEFDTEIHWQYYHNELYRRNVGAVEKLGLTRLSWIGVPGNHGQKEEFTEHVRTSYIAGERKYDIIATYSRTAAHCMIEGLLADLNAIEASQIDLSQEWWTERLLEDLTVDRSLYFVTGDISMNLTHMMYAIFCNEALREELKLEDPACLALEGDWTLEAFLRLSEGAYLDLNGNETVDYGADRFGFVTAQLHVDSFYHGAGFRLIQRDPIKGLEISPDFTSNRMETLSKTLTAFFSTRDAAVGGDYEKTFVDGRALFTQNRLYYADRKLKNVDFDYTVLPIPKYLGTQEGYRTCVANPVSLWGIMVDVEMPMKVECTALIEYFASFAYAEITPVILRNQVSYSIGEEDYEKVVRLFELIRKGVVLDYGRILPNSEMGDYMNEIFSRRIVGNEYDVSLSPNSETVICLRVKLAYIVERLRDGVSPPPVTEPLT